MILTAALTLTLADFRHLISIEDAQISNDGNAVAYVQGTPNFAKDWYDDALRVVSAQGGESRTLLAGHPIDSPRWSASDQSIAYLAKSKGGTIQIFVVPSRGGTPRQLTHAKNDVEQFAWSPDGSRLAYVTEDEALNPSAAERGENLFDVHDDGYLTSDKPESSHLWLIAAQGGTARRLTEGSWSVMESAPPFVGSVTDPSWSPDGKYIVFTKQADTDDSDSDLTTIAAVNVQTGVVGKIGSHPKYEYQPIYSPDRDVVAYLSPRGPGPISVLNVFVAGDGSERDVTADLDADVGQAAPVAKNGLLLLAPQGATNALFFKPATGPARRLDLGTLTPFGFSVARNGAIAFVASRTDLPPEVYVTSIQGGSPKRLTFANRYFERFSYGRSADITWTAPDGERSDGILTYPVGYVAERKYPLILRIHGGPEASSDAGFNVLRQLWANRGYLVFEPNYRGSDNLGTAHEHAIYRDPGTGPGNDVMAGIAAIEKMAIVDTSRIAVTGHSYGGYMTTWLIGHEHIWKAAVVGDGMVDWLQEYDDSAAGNLAWTRDSLGGTPMDPASADLYRTGSPITYVAQITTPTLVISGTADETVPATESYELYHALHDRGIPVRFVAIPNAHHFPTDPAHIEGYDRVTLDWVERYL
jgi:dipeptidyl aminopeptidase/acylaminoacyl peptidase